MIGRELLRDALDQAVRIGRMTREDVEQLSSVFVQVAGRQARDALSEVGRRASGPLDRVRGRHGSGDG
ncbi:MAG: hypothetical protein ACR2LK_00390, partial [Solirubrobacteraceae bacterium]